MDERYPIAYVPIGGGIVGGVPYIPIGSVPMAKVFWYYYLQNEELD